ncbi:MAG: heme ABC exporter ATP-binding protein CcmA [Anaerolineales bacterium]
MIRAEKISKRYGERLVLQGVDLRVKKGELVALLGPNGAGKSTLLRILACLARPSFGQFEIAGNRLPEQADAARRALGYLGHQPILYGDLSAEQNLGFYARLYGMARPEKRIRALLSAFDLYTRRSEAVRTFSRGMQQRLSLARALLHSPKVLLLDEPHSGLDREAVRILDGMLKQVARKGTAILLATHDLERAQRLADRVEVLTAGRLVTSLNKRQLASRQFSATYDRALRTARRRQPNG